ncbi:MAG: sialate O-acetylesterase [Pirellulaceae bacterium]|nr:sialate O-acetylesterase [Pirellulaceae bacterium]
MTLIALTFVGVALNLSGYDEPLKIYILAGQSNMEGHAKVETFDYIGDDPETVGLLKQMRGADGKPRISDKVWISYLTGSGDRMAASTGRLTVGFGARKDPALSGGKIGPEFTFGLFMEKKSQGPILIIKTAWGGKSLHTDFRPPSAGPYQFDKAHLDSLKKRGRDVEQFKSDRSKATGRYYRLMIDHVKKVLENLDRVCPRYQPRQGYEMAGLVWFQGWNDMVDSNTYPNRRDPGGYDLYTELLAHFIRDVRRDLSVPKMPFVIGVMGVNGLQKEPNYFRLAMAAPASTPEFSDNVVAVQTAPYWDKDLAAIIQKRDKVKKIRYFIKKGNVPAKAISKSHPEAYRLRKKYWDTPSQSRSMTKVDQQAYLQEYQGKLITSKEEIMLKRGASNAGYHYLGSAKTMALIGKAFAEALQGLK